MPIDQHLSWQAWLAAEETLGGNAGAIAQHGADVGLRRLDAKGDDLTEPASGAPIAAGTVAQGLLLAGSKTPADRSPASRTIHVKDVRTSAAACSSTILTRRFQQISSVTRSRVFMGAWRRYTSRARFGWRWDRASIR